jgi:hypothetical protein
VAYLPLICALIGIACGTSSSGGPASEAGSDSGEDGTGGDAEVEAGADTPAEVGVDAPSEGGPETSLDGGDATIDGNIGIEAGEGGPDAPADVHADVPAEVGADVVADVAGEVVAESASDVAADVAGDVPADESPDIVSDASVDAAPDVEGGLPRGTLQGATTFAATGSINPTGLALDSTNGDILLAGYFAGTVNFGGGPLTSGDAGASTSGAFVLRLDSARSYKWGLGVKSNGGVVAYGVAVDGAGRVVIGGQIGGPADFGGGQLTPTGTEDLFLAMYNASGTYVWSKHFGYAGSIALFRHAAFDSSGNLYVVGRPEGNAIDLGCGALPAGMTMFVAKFDSGGACVWSHAYAAYNSTTQTNYTQSETLAIDPSDQILVAGGFYGAVDFGSGALTAPGIGMDVFVQKLSPTGSVTWAKNFGSGGSVAQATGIAADTSGNILLDGTFSQTLDFGVGTLTESGTTGAGDIFLAKLDSSGNGVWSKSFGDSSGQLGGPIALDDAGGPAITGSFSGTMNLGGGSLAGAAAGSSSAYIAKFSTTGAYEWGYGGGPPASSASGSAGYGIGANASVVAATGVYSGGTLNLGGTALTTGGAFLVTFVP